MEQSSMEKCPFMDTLWGFALKLFGILLFSNILSQIFTFVIGNISEILGALLTDILVFGMGVMIHVTAVYQVAWNKGFRDLGLVSRNVVTYKSRRGLVAGLLASVPGFILYLFLLLSLSSETLLPIGRFGYKLINAYGFLLIEQLIALGPWGTVLTILLLVPMPLVAWMGYVWGYRNKLVTKSVMYGKNDPTNSNL